MDLVSALGVGYLIATIGRGTTAFLYLRFGEIKK
jgi:hypothetical protein